MKSFADIQQAFVRRYMDDGDYVIGVRIREIDGEMVLYVEVGGHNPVGLPETFRDLPVVVRKGRRAILAYS